MSWKDNFPKENRYFETDKGILYCGDCIEIMKKIEENSIDLIVTSPPYNVGIDYDSWDDRLELEEYLNFLEKFSYGMKRVLKEYGGRFAVNLPYDVKMRFFKTHIRISLIMEYYEIIKKIGLKFYTIIDLNEKTPEITRLTAWGSWLSAKAPYIYNPKEALLVGYKKEWKKENKGITNIDKELFQKLVIAIWDYNPETNGLTKANFSEDIPYNAMKILTYENDIILDPFMGSGTTALVAEKNNRRWIGIELSEKYCNVIKNRIEKRISDYWL